MRLINVAWSDYYMEREVGKTLSMQALAERRRREIDIREKGVRVNDALQESELKRGPVPLRKMYCLGGWAGKALTCSYSPKQRKQ